MTGVDGKWTEADEDALIGALAGAVNHMVIGDKSTWHYQTVTSQLALSLIEKRWKLLLALEVDDERV